MDQKQCALANILHRKVLYALCAFLKVVRPANAVYLFRQDEPKYPR
jgi:hypothetical protein